MNLNNLSLEEQQSNYPVLLNILLKYIIGIKEQDKETSIMYLILEFSMRNYIDIELKMNNYNSIKVQNNDW